MSRPGAELLAREAQYVDDLRVYTRKDDDRRHLLAGAWSDGYCGVDTGHVLVGDGADALAAVESLKAALRFSSGERKPLLIGFIAFLQRLDAGRDHLFEAREATGVDLSLCMADDVLRQVSGVE